MPPPSAKEEGQNIVQRNNSTLFEITTRVQHENWQTIQPTISNPHLDRPCHGKRLLWAGDTATGKTEKYQIWSQQFLWWALSGWSCQGLSRDNVETGEERSRRLWWCETMIFSQLPWLTLFSTAHLSLHTHCSHSPTYGLLSVECWDLHIGLITEQPSLSVPQSVLAALCACERPARRPASRLCYLVVDRQVGTQLGPDQGPEQEFHQNAKLNISGNACLAWQLPQHLLSGANKHFIPGRNNLRGRSLFNVKCSCPN